MEVGAGVGLCSYFGDFNGSVLKGQQPWVAAVFRRTFTPHTALKAVVGWGKAKGSSANADTHYEAYKDAPHTFDRQLYEVSAAFEYNFWPYGTGKEYRGAKRLTPFVWAGVGCTVAGGGETTATAALPIGAGVKYKVAERLNIAVEWGARFTLSDKIDLAEDPYGIQSKGLFKNTDGYATLMATITYSFAPKCPTCLNDKD